MGCTTSTPGFQAIPDQYKSFEELTKGLRRAGLEKSQLVVGVDFTDSNRTNGARTFGGRCLHDVSDPATANPYMQALSIIAKALWDFDDDHLIPSYGFGDLHTGSQRIFSFQANDEPCKGLVGCANRYQDIAQSVRLAGPTSFAPLIRQAIKLVRETNEYHILLIVADGQVSKSEIALTTQAIVEASNYALSIVMVGVGDGPWHLMDHFDDNLPERRFDNFQFVEFGKVFHRYPAERREAAFATHALMEVPAQYQAVKRLGLLRESRRLPDFKAPPEPCGPPDQSSTSDLWHGLPAGWDACWDSQTGLPVYINFATVPPQQSYERPPLKDDPRRCSQTSNCTSSTTTAGRSSLRSSRSSESSVDYRESSR